MSSLIRSKYYEFWILKVDLFVVFGRSTSFWRGFTSRHSFSFSGRRAGVYKRLAGQEGLQGRYKKKAPRPRGPENSRLLVLRPPPSALPSAGRTLCLRPRTWWAATLDQTSEEDETQRLYLNLRNFLMNTMCISAHRTSWISLHSQPWSHKEEEVQIQATTLHHFWESFTIFSPSEPDAALAFTVIARWHLSFEEII